MSEKETPPFSEAALNEMEKILQRALYGYCKECREPLEKDGDYLQQSCDCGDATWRVVLKLRGQS